jgi:N-acetylneuraminic acid mutarotase
MTKPSIAILLFTMIALLGAAAQPVQAHFPWLATDDEGRALLYFGESPADRQYHLPEAIAVSKVHIYDGDRPAAEAALETIDQEGFIGRRSEQPVGPDALLETTCEYGLYHGMLLTYYARHLPGEQPADRQPPDGKGRLRLEIVPKAAGDCVTFTVAWDGIPLADAAVTLIDASGEPREAKTNDRGKAAFVGLPEGLVGVTASYIEDAKGEVDGKPYHSAGHYSTLTFHNARAIGGGSALGAIPALPEPLASFGAAVCDGWLYVYSGHVGAEHEHSRENLSQHFRRIELDGGRQWEELPMQTPLQGLPLAAYQGKLYRVGGLSARNAAGEAEDLHSVDEFAAFDPQTNTWTSLPPLPEPRSSHDAAIVDGVLYVVGGWRLEGSSKGAWSDAAWSFDLSQPNGQWRALPALEPHRRALAAGQWQGKLVAIGGMGEDRKITRRVDVFDQKNAKWRRLADLPGEGMGGFGVSACNLDGKLYVSGTQDSLYCLIGDGAQWSPIARLAQPRFFHRLTPAASPGALLVIAGASDAGHLATTEEVSISRRPAPEP